VLGKLRLEGIGVQHERAVGGLQQGGCPCGSGRGTAESGTDANGIAMVKDVFDEFSCGWQQAGDVIRESLSHDAGFVGSDKKLNGAGNAGGNQPGTGSQGGDGCEANGSAEPHRTTQQRHFSERSLVTISGAFRKCGKAAEHEVWHENLPLRLCTASAF
jgi:hypothetical protein